MEDLHTRFIGDWLVKPSPDFVHPHCTWTMSEDYPVKGTYKGTDFYTWYNNHFAVSYKDWKPVITEVIGSPIGAIVVGKLYFKDQFQNYVAPFTHFYRIRQGKIVSAQYFIGVKTISIYHTDILVDMFPWDSFPSIN
ncbi:hypothetical protein GCM10028818_56190 [Spirosoma horti]